MPKKKVAIVCDWLTNLGGAERVVEQMHKAFPQAPIFTSLYRSEKLPAFKDADVRTSWLQKVPGAKRKHQLFLPLFPMVFEGFDLSEYDIILSSSFACAKGVITNTNQVHICYCHNPTRYFWDESHQFWDRYSMPRLAKWFGKFFLHDLRVWDRVAAERPDYYLANSSFVQKRLQKYYRKEAEVLHPGIELGEYEQLERGDFYLAVGRLTAQKHFDLVVESFNELKLPLKIVGMGPALDELKCLNKSEHTEFLGFVSDEELQNLYGTAKALVFPQAEDFGIVPIEAQAQGCPVIAYGYGGALETVYAGEDGGSFFTEQSVNCLVTAVQDFEKMESDSVPIRKQALAFAADNFREGLRKFVDAHSTP